MNCAGRTFATASKKFGLPPPSVIHINGIEDRRGGPVRSRRFSAEPGAVQTS